MPFDFLSMFDSEKKLQPNQYSSLTLAYIGDCVYELYVRLYLIKDKDYPVKVLHKTSTGYVKASAQAEYFQKIQGVLSEEELAVFHRGRNAKSHPPKNADMIDYKIATGVETLIGYTYLCGNRERLMELLKYIKDVT